MTFEFLNKLEVFFVRNSIELSTLSLNVYSIIVGLQRKFDPRHSRLFFEK